MSHEVIQVKLVKYNIKSHEIIGIKHNNGKEENDIRTNTHMKWCGFGTESPSGLHCTNWYGYLDHLMGQFLNCLCIGSITSTNLNLPLPSSNHTNESVTLQHASKHMNSHEYQYTHIRVHTCTHIHTTYIHVHSYTLNIHAYTYTP